MEGRTRKLRKLNYNENLDRFIPNRSAMDFDFAHYMLTGGKVEKEITEKCSTSSQVYIKDLAETLNLNRTRILEFKNKAPTSSNIIHDLFSPIRRRKYVERIRNIPQNPERILDAPEIIDDFYLNILDWSCRNVVAIAMKNTVYFWDASNGKTHELLSVDDEVGPVTSVRWSPDGRHIAIGFNNSHVELWDSSAKRRLRTFLGIHGLRVSSLDWNEQILTTGGMDSLIINNDVRIRSYKVGTYSGHSGEVCGLRWSSSGRQLASGGNDNLLYIWCMSMASSNSRTQWLHRFDDHSATVKAVSWCPFQSNLLASGGGAGDKCIKFWNSNTGACLNSVNTGSQVSSLLWNTHEREILSGHGFDDNQLTLWNYPSMVRVAELQGHASRVLGMAQSPDGYTVASIAADETLKFWNVFGTPSSQGKTVVKREREPFANAPHIR